MLVGHGFKLAPSGVEFTATESCLGQPKLKMRYKVICGQKAFKVVPLRAIGLGNDNRGSPLGFEALEVLGSFFDVNLDGNEMFVDECGYLLVEVDLGIQPGASRSHRGGAEIEQNGLMLRLSLLQSLVGIAYPLQFSHGVNS